MGIEERSMMSPVDSQHITGSLHRSWIRLAFMIALIFLITATPLAAQLRPTDKFWRFDELLVVGDDIFIGASAEWFANGQALPVYSQWESNYRYLQVGDASESGFISADKTGRLFITTERDLYTKSWTYYGPARVADEGLTAIVHQQLTTDWHNKNDPEEIKGVWPVLLRPAKEPTIIRDKDGVERKVFKAVLVKQPLHQQFRFTVSRVRKEDFYPNVYLLGSGQYSVSGLCVYRGEVYYAAVRENQFDPKEWTDYWLPDAPFLVTKWEGKFRLLSVTEEGEVKLADRATLNTYWYFSAPKKEAIESPIGFHMHNFKSHRDSREIRYLVPDDKPVVVKDRNGKDVELFRLKLGKDRKSYRIYRYAP